MERTDGKKGRRGVCGIARSPSVALGGMFSEDVELLSDDEDDDEDDDEGEGDDSANDDGGRDGRRKRSDSHEGRSEHPSSKTTISRASSQIQSLIHRIRSHLGFVQKGIMMSTVNGSEEDGQSNIIPYSLLTTFAIVCFLLTFLVRKRRRTRRRHREPPPVDDESVATNWSQVAHAGERASLLTHGRDLNYYMT
mmetsp:Transcript_1304/g.2704  ORF Transcript_1304/g.2704 Transcript_1304/m.2704 type:complete len:194 (+) Transcript_1304:44-625(+)